MLECENKSIQAEESKESKFDPRSNAYHPMFLACGLTVLRSVPSKCKM